jgi:hypothetical protein
MKKIFVGLFVLVAMQLSLGEDAVIGDNFKRAGLLIDGSGSFRVLSKSSEGDRNLNWYVRPRVGLFFIDNFLISLGLAHDGRRIYRSSSSYDTELFYNKEMSLIWTVDLALNFYFGYKKDSRNGFAHSVGISGETGFEYSNSYDVTGDTLNIEHLSYVLQYGALYNVYYFITPTIAPNLSLNWNDIDFTDTDTFIPSLYFGFSYFIPTSKRVLIKAKQR